jgi:hypothetical protein
MIIAGFMGENTAPGVAPTITPPVAASNATRAPFTRPPQARANFVPRSLDTGFIPEFEVFPTVMLPQMPRIPQGIRNPLASEPQSGGVPTMGPAMPQAAGPAGVSSPIKMRSGFMFPPGLVQALGIMPPIRGVRAGRVNPGAMVAAGRKPGMV